MKDLKQFEVWFVTGSQNLYGPETLRQVDEDSKQIAKYLDDHKGISCKVVFKPVVTTTESIKQVCVDANNAANCIGLMTWMHTFSPAKMWIAGLNALRKPFVHFHTQFNRDIPWATIDMDFMNLNQSAHGCREFGFICSRLRKNRKVVVGHWKDEEVIPRLDSWMRAACAWQDWQGMKICRFGDNMRYVAVTEGDKVEAEKKLGYSVNTYAVGDLVAIANKVTDKEVDKMVAEYKATYKVDIDEAGMKQVRESARLEVALRTFMNDGGFKAFTNCFEDLHGMNQLPGLPTQRLMADGFGYGAEGDWKTSALVRAFKVMGTGLKGGSSFMEDYTYHLDPKDTKVLGAHMLEVCGSMADGKASLEVHPLGIGGKADPARLVFNVAEGKGLNATMMDMGNRFRMLINPCDVVKANEGLPNLPVARVIWKPMPDLKTSAAAWILGGGTHHAAFSMAITKEHVEDFAAMADIEAMVIDEGTTISEFKKELRTNEVYYMLGGSLK